MDIDLVKFKKRTKGSIDSPAGGSGVIHGVLVGLRRRLGSPRAARHRRSRGEVLAVHSARIITVSHYLTRTSIISNSLTLVASQT